MAEQQSTTSELNIQCPYCGEEFEAPDDPHMEQCEEQEFQCPKCGKYLDVYCEWTPTYTSTTKEQPSDG